MSNLAATYMGLALPSPLVVSSNPLTGKLENIQKLAEAGAGAIILPSLFEEQIQLEDAGWDLEWYREHPDAPAPDIIRNMPQMDKFNRGSGLYLSTIYRAKQQAFQTKIIASLNGSSKGGWVRYAKMMESVGADAIELNIYHLPTETYISSSEVEDMYVRLLEAVKESISIPVAVKLNPYFTSLPHIAKRLDDAGADALVLFNRFYEPDFDLETESVVPNLVLSHSDELRLRLRWVGILQEQIDTDLAVTGGVHTAVDLLKSILAGAHVGMMASAILKNGPEHIRTVLDETQIWMNNHGYTSIAQMRGHMSRRAVRNPNAFERANYMQVLSSYEEEKEKTDGNTA